MPQHLWQRIADVRVCDVCDVTQHWHMEDGSWMPPVSPICPGDAHGSRQTRPAPSGNKVELEAA